MKLLEFQAKKILEQNGIRVPAGTVVENLADLDQLAYPCVLKAQVPVGGRGKAGGIVKVNDVQAARRAVKKLFSLSIKGYGINTLLAETAHSIEKEIYLSCLNDKEKNQAMFMASTAGGVDIETLAKASPDKIIIKHVDTAVGLMEYDIQSLASGLGLVCDAAFVSIVRGMWNVLRQEDATLVEINPLAQTDKGLMALDAKIVLDDNAAYRHREKFLALKKSSQGKILKKTSEPERLAEKYDISYVELEGDIGIIADGAGTGMLTLDMVKDFGGRPANFCEMGGKAAEEAAEQSMEIVLANDKVKVLLISLIGGLTRMDRVAAGIDDYLTKNKCRVPIVVRMCGTKAEEGRQILSRHGIQAFEDLFATVKAAVEMGGN